MKLRKAISYINIALTHAWLRLGDYETLLKTLIERYKESEFERKMYEIELEGVKNVIEEVKKAMALIDEVAGEIAASTIADREIKGVD